MFFFFTLFIVIFLIYLYEKYRESKLLHLEFLNSLSQDDLSVH
jgi:hypothetical protein